MWYTPTELNELVSPIQEYIHFLHLTIQVYGKKEKKLSHYKELYQQ